MKIIKSFFFFLILFIIFFSLILNIIYYRNKLSFYQEHLREFEKEKLKKIKLQTEILKKTDPYYLEKVFRNNLNLSKPNELVFILPTPNTPVKAPTPTPMANWQQWANVFINSVYNLNN